MPAVPFDNPENYVHVADRLAGELAKTEPNGVLYTDQWNRHVGPGEAVYAHRGRGAELLETAQQGGLAPTHEPTAGAVFT